jgi:hypothetical protein
MAFDYSGLNTTAQTLLSDFGRDVVLRQRSNTLIDPARPSRGFNTGNVDLTVKAVFASIKKDQFQESAIEDGDQLCIVSALAASGIEIGTDDLIVDAGDVLQIVAVDKVKPGGTTMVWKLAVRR